MNATISKNTPAILLALAILMAATRSHHFASTLHLPDASWAVFFLIGFYVSSRWALGGLLALAGLSDYMAISWFGVSDFCVSPAYLLLAPAYGSLWLAGRWFSRRYRFHPSALLPLAGSVLAGSVVCELLSSGGFYLFSGRLAETSLAGFAAQFVEYFPATLAGMMLYLVTAAIAHILFELAGRGLPRSLSGTGHTG